MNSWTIFQKTKYLLIFLLYSLASIGALQAQFSIPAPPKKIYPVNDFAQVLTQEHVYHLNKKLIRYNKSTSTEILVTIVKTLNGEDANLVGANWGEKWKIGQKKQDNGLILLLSIDDRKISIQTGYGIEPYLTDALSRRIIENQIKPALLQGDYYRAIDQGTTAIFQVLKDTYINKKKTSKKDNGWENLLLYLLLILFLFYFFRSGGNSGGRRRSVYYDEDPFTLSSMGRWSGHHGGKLGSGWGSDSGEGGFGGGGNFGGGGASGNWVRQPHGGYTYDN
ncbi:MAG: TPM domain-containing protein [Flavobacteriales bacterium AspAUS03]